MKPRVKQILSYGLRFGVAIVGVLFIVLTLNWADHVVVPPTMLPPGAAPDGEPVSLRIVEQTPEQVVAVLPNGGEVRLDAAAVGLGDNPEQARLKPGILTTLRGADWGMIGIGLVLVGVILPVQAVRWHILLRSQGVPATLARATRLTYVGMFFNICMPGTTGGDVVKAYYAARGSSHRTKAVMSVFVDRVAGLLGLILLGAVAGLLVLDDPLAARVTMLAWALLLGGCGGAAIYFSDRARRRLGLAWLLARAGKVPKLSNVDAAAQAYRHSPGALFAALAISLPVHIILAISCALAGYALGLQHSLGLMIAVLPIVFLAGSIPISVQGLGVMEALTLGLLLDPPAATTNQLVGMLLIYRLFMIFWALVGALALLGGSVRLQGEPEPAAA